MSFRTYVLLHLFTALLPPKDGSGEEMKDDTVTEHDRQSHENAADNDDIDDSVMEYYAWLGLSKRRRKSLTQTDIRQAYRQLSLQYHPDKVAQRSRHAPAQEVAAAEAEARAKYQYIQEAYGVLSVPDHRRTYHAVDCSVERYRFLQGELYAHPAQLYHNLQQASCLDQSKLFGLVVLLAACVLIQPVLLAVKINTVNNPDSDSVLANVDWILICLPTWILYGGFILLWIVATVAVAAVLSTRKGHQKGRSCWTSPILSMTLMACQHVCLYLGMFFLVRQWDLNAEPGRDRSTTDWHELSIPFYLSLAFLSLARRVDIWRLRAEQDKMVSPERYEILLVQREDDDDDQEPTATATADATVEDDRAEAGDDDEPYNVVTVNEQMVVGQLEALRVLRAEQGRGGEQEAPDITEEELEALRVASSPEYQMIYEQMKVIAANFWTSVVFLVPVIALTASKLEGQISASWWVVFIPLWVYFGTRLLYACCVCTCTPTAGETFAVVGSGASDSEDGDATDPEEGSPSGDNRNNDNGVTSSGTAFATPEGNMQEFNQSIVQPPSQQPTATSDEETGLGGPTTQVKDTATPPMTVEGGGADGDDNGDEPETIPTLDEETYRRYKTAFEQADQSAMEAQAKAQWSCCSMSFQLITVCLIVGKLEAEYQADESGGEGYNALIILIPVFVVAGLILCCCACLIYCAPPLPSPEDMPNDCEPDQENAVNAVDENETEDEDKRPASANDAASTPTPAATETATAPPATSESNEFNDASASNAASDDEGASDSKAVQGGENTSADVEAGTNKAEEDINDLD